jgi:hypothetical protein
MTAKISHKLPPDLEQLIDKDRPSKAKRANGEDVHAAELPPATPWWRDPAEIPRRQFLHDHHYARRVVSATVAAGGRAKTTLGCEEAVSMTLGRDLLTGEDMPSGPLRVLMLNGEEEQDELDRRIAAVCQHFQISKADLGDRLFAISVRARPPKLATMVKGNPVVNTAAVEAITARMLADRIDVLMIDPLVSFHRVPENFNLEMDVVLKEACGAIAIATGAAVEVFHHIGKPKPGAAEASIDDARGASAIVAAVRSARVMNFMTPDVAAKLGIPEDQRKLHIQIVNGKANAGPTGRGKWIKLEVEHLPNGDAVACGTSWKPSDPFLGITTADMMRCRNVMQGAAYRLNSQAQDWVGYAIAEALGIDVTFDGDNDPKDVARLKEILRTWFKNKVLAKEPREDKHRNKRDFVIPGPWKPEPQSNEETDELLPF